MARHYGPNTHGSTAAINLLGVSPVESHHGAPAGGDPVAYLQGSASELRRPLNGRLRRLIGPEALLPHQITILPPRKVAKSSLAELSQAATTAAARTRARSRA